MVNNEVLRKFAEDWLMVSFELEEQIGRIPTNSEVNKEFIRRLTMKI